MSLSIRRFTNPHPVLQQLQIVSRTDLYAEHDHSNQNSAGDIETLQSLLTETLQPNTEDGSRSLSRTKRRKVVKEATSENTVLFRLVSSSLPPLPVSLLPPLPASPISREPEAEDNKAEAILRKQRSEIVAVDGKSILLGANPTKKNDRVININLQATVQIPTPSPAMLVITKKQPPRNTRPPVLSSELKYHPYVSQGPTNPAALPNTKICPVVDMESSGPKFKSSRRQRRKRLKESSRQRPEPRFWRPDPSWSGPCRGYAFGYPSSFASGEREYQRDRMKKAILPSLQ